jgi:hypothetical protein
VFLVWTVARGAWLPDIALSLPSVPSWLSVPADDGAASWLLVRAAVAVGVTAWLILAPVALYFALRRD